MWEGKHVLIESSMKCYLMCMRAIKHCLTSKKIKNKKQLVQIMSDCAASCRTTAYTILFTYETQSKAWAECRWVCQRCIRSIENIKDDAELKQCVEACREFEELCRKTIQD